MGEVEPRLKQPRSIKKLLVLPAIKSRAISEEIGQALRVDSSTVRKMLPMKKTKKSKGD
jgi:hypothetical protein